MRAAERLAIVGIGGIFPGAPDPDRFWALNVAALDATGPVPDGRWRLDPATVFDPRPAIPDRVYSTRGGFIEDFQFDPDGLRLDPDLIGRLDPSFYLALHAGRAAWRDARTEGLDHQRVGVVLGNIVLPTEATSALTREILGRTLAEQIGLDNPGPMPSTDPINRHAAGLPAGLLARALGLGGGSYTLDAACASSLYALKLAADELRTGRADAMLTGGLARPDPLYTQMGFSQLRALSPRGVASPFDAAADGLVVGEGAGVFVLKRLDDAIRQGDHIYGLLAAVGLSNDVDGGLLAPSLEGQLRAMRAAYESAGWDPRDIDLIECHATGTPIGDAVEFASLRALWGDQGWTPGRCTIGSVKSNIGHTLTAAGASGLLRVLLALKHRTLPPTANFVQPGSKIGLDGSPFRILSEPIPWEPGRTDRPRRAAISGFGFGGINAHALIEEWVPGSPRTLVAMPAPPIGEAPIAIIGLAAHFGPSDDLRTFSERTLGGSAAGLPIQRSNDWGVSESRCFIRKGLSKADFRGFGLDSVAIPSDRFRIPPVELEEMLPQQSLMLKVAAEALADAGQGDQPSLRSGVFIGIELDPNTTNFDLRWSMADLARDADRQLGLGLAADEIEDWARSLRDAAGPPLTANRTMGALGGLIASRIAREFRIGGPSFSVSSGESSGARALGVAAGLLRVGEIDQAIIGAVDLPSDIRTVLATHRLGDRSRPFNDGAAALVLKRLDDARRDGDRIMAVIRGIGVAAGERPSADREAMRRALDASGIESGALGYLEAHGAACSVDGASETFAGCCLGDAETAIGHAGAASALASIARAALSLDHRILPPLNLDPEIDLGPYLRPREPQYWLRDRIDGPRRAAVRSAGIDGNSIVVILEEAEDRGPRIETPQPLGARPAALFAIEADGPDILLELTFELESLAATARGPIEDLARVWWHRHPGDPGRTLGAAITARTAAELRDLTVELRRRINANGGQVRPDDRIAYAPRPLDRGSGLAFVFPGSGNQFAGMGRSLAAHWPEILDEHDRQNDRLRSQLAPGTYWNVDPPSRFDDLRAPILGQVALGSFLSDLIRSFGIMPDAAIGYSLGETSSLVALGAWADRDQMHARLIASPLFQHDLAGPCNAARRAWGLDESEPVAWVAGIVPAPIGQVRAAIGDEPRTYVLIVNTPGETVIGGDRAAIDRVIGRLGSGFVPLSAVATVHCAVAREVEEAYRDLHLLRTTPPPGVRFYSGAWGKAYVPDRESAAGAIVANALHGFDFPALIHRAHADGIRHFVEIGPGGSCTRMIGAILDGRPHTAVAACLPNQEPVASFLKVLGRLIAERAPVDLGPLYGRARPAVGHRSGTIDRPARLVRVAVGGAPFAVLRPPSRHPDHNHPKSGISNFKYQISDSSIPSDSNAHYVKPEISDFKFQVPNSPPSSIPISGADPLHRQILATETARAWAHAAYLRLSDDLTQSLSNQLQFQMALIEALVSTTGPPSFARFERPGIDDPRSEEVPVLDRASCLEFAVGSIGAVLGPEFAAIDAHPTRVRLPDEPLMLVDRIMTIEGEPRSLSKGRVVTEHDVRAGAWYLDGDRVVPSVAIESGQADLFLSAYLGIDFITQGRAVYRLLDATVTFHRGLPGPGSIIRYDIHIDQFFRQGDTHLFRFRFEATVGGEPLLSMTDGCAGFFKAEELAAGRGIVRPELDRRPRPGVRPLDWEDLVPLVVESFDSEQLEALRRGDLAAAFGPSFEGLGLSDPPRLPGGRLALVHRVARLDPHGGKYGLGLIRGEADIQADDWFLTCHFVDDQVMPGTLMYESCLQTLRIFLIRLGWVGDRVACEPVPGVASRLRCRGQVTESTRMVGYEISIKELGYGPEPFAIADALMFADGRPIVEVTDLSLRLAGLDRESVRRTWARKSAPPVFDRAQILAFATGKPSACFGARYRPFDEGRFLARLPGPPFLFVDRIASVQAEPWVVRAGGAAVAHHDVPPGAWYFEADRQDRMPLVVLLEVALQSCGWLAAYMGSALTSGADLAFRNLGGSAVALAPVDRASGTLTTSVKVTKAYRSGDTLVQHYDYEVRSRIGVVYRGDATFGFFTRDALARQSGIPGAAFEDGVGRAPFDYPSEAPFPDERLRMIERIDIFDPSGGPERLGLIEGSCQVDPESWYFRAHFHQDPVCPGSLGLEALQQLLKVVAAARWGDDPKTAFESPAPGARHDWTYRGQVLPSSRSYAVQAIIRDIDDERRLIRADGLLSVDGKVIYKMSGFTLGWDVR